MRVGRAGAGAAVALIVAMMAAGADQAAACGDSRTSGPTKAGRGGKAPLAIGDSTMLLSVVELGKRGFRANARGCRHWPEGMSVIKQAKRQGGLPDYVVIHLGANSAVSRQAIRQAMRIVGKRTKLGLVTPRELGGGSGSDAANVRAMGKRYPNRIVVIDWVKRAAGHREWFAPDGLHINLSGIKPYVNLIADSIPKQKLRPLKTQSCGDDVGAVRIAREIEARGLDCDEARAVWRDWARRRSSGRKRTKFRDWRCRYRTIERGFGTVGCKRRKRPWRTTFKIASPQPAPEGAARVGVMMPKQGQGRLTLGSSGSDSGSSLVITREPGKPVVIFDRSGGEIANAAGEHCARLELSRVSCESDRLDESSFHTIRLGAGDELRFGDQKCGQAAVRAGLGGIVARGRPGQPASVWGSPGGDAISLTGPGRIHGCAGADGLTVDSGERGRAGRAFGDAGRDSLVSFGRTVIRGGRGKDRLEQARGGGTAFGGPSADVMLEGAGRSRLAGGAGDDRIGCSTLFVISKVCGRGRDNLIGGPGRDAIFSGYRSRCAFSTCNLRAAAPDRLDCGSGRDRARAGKGSRVRRCGGVQRLPLAVRQFKR